MVKDFGKNKTGSIKSDRTTAIKFITLPALVNLQTSFHGI